MKLKFEAAPLEYTINSMCEIFDEKQSSDFQKYICDVYPSIVLDEIMKLDGNEKMKYVKGKIQDLYNEKKDTLDKKACEYQKKWDECETDIINCYNDIFGYDTDKAVGEIKVRVGINPICPRYLNSGMFDTYYILSPEKNIMNAIHELTHFVWFDLWKKLFPDFKKETFEYPHLIWIFSEIAIDPILRDKRFSKFCNMEKPAYECFYGIEIQNKNMIEEIRKLYEENTIEDFMKKGIKYCARNFDTLKRYV